MIPEDDIAILMNVAQMDLFVLPQLDESAGVASVHLEWYIRWHRIEALQELSVAMVDDETVLIVGIVVAYLGIDIVETRSMHSQDTVDDTKVLLPLVVHAGGGMSHIHIPMKS